MLRKSRLAVGTNEYDPSAAKFTSGEERVTGALNPAKRVNRPTVLTAQRTGIIIKQVAGLTGKTRLATGQTNGKYFSDSDRSATCSELLPSVPPVGTDSRFFLGRTIRNAQ